ncbi:MAG: T9SS type A sorting domain-containing protein, partial [Bacteroidota bacterium]|nr:T9SS type A sorting domain-containing protein [Bacteroidota bacterium]
IVPLVGGEKFALRQNKPNPFNPSTIIEYVIGEETDVRLTVFDQLGREVAVLVNARQKAGTYAVIFDGSHLSSGTYTYRLDTPQFTKTLRMVLAR